MAKKEKKILLIGAAAVAALYFWNKNRTKNDEFIKPAKQVSTATVVNAPIKKMASAKPQMLNPINNALNAGLNLKKFTDNQPTQLQRTVAPVTKKVAVRLSGINDVIL